MRHNTKLNGIQHIDTQPISTKVRRYKTQHKDTQHNTIQHNNNKLNAALSTIAEHCFAVMLSVTLNPFMLSVVMLSVVAAKRWQYA